jgi:hypothetical protein
MEGSGLQGFATVCSFQSWQRHAHAEELGFRDFSSLFPVKENRRQLGNSACCISFTKVRLTIASLRNAQTKRKWIAMLTLESGDRIEQFYEDSPKATIPATVGRLLSDRDEGMNLV